MPRVLLIGGPNGAGKTTAAKRLLANELRFPVFVNADEIAAELCPEDPASKALDAGRRMVKELARLREARSDIAFESTLAARTPAQFLRRCKDEGYTVQVMYFWLPSPEMAIRRVATRVARGGHDIPEEVIRRRYTAGLKNMFELYMPIADRWAIYDSAYRVPKKIAQYSRDGIMIFSQQKWSMLCKRVKTN